MLIMSLSHEHKISISALCKKFKMSRSSFYYQKRGFVYDEKLVSLIKHIFEHSEANYGARRIKVGLSAESHEVSRRKIRQIMALEGLRSNHTKSSYKPQTTQSVKSESPDLVNQEFDGRSEYEVMVSDTTYIQINGVWNYLCIVLDLCGRFLDGFSVGQTKDATLAQSAIFSVKCDLRKIGIFHTDKGSEFVNKLMDKTLRAFGIKRSTGKTGVAYDNAVAESMFKTIKIEFVKGRSFKSLEQFSHEFSDWVNKYNNERYHSSLDYLTPAEYRRQMKEKQTSNLSKNVG
jgi:putative transposase